MRPDVIIDTSTLIRFTRLRLGQNGLDDLLARYHYITPAASATTKFEFEYGEVRARRLIGFSVAFPRVEVVSVNQRIWQRALYVQDFSVDVNREMSLADLLIASTAIAYRLPLITDNFGDFKHLQDPPHYLKLPKLY